MKTIDYVVKFNCSNSLEIIDKFEFEDTEFASPNYHSQMIKRYSQLNGRSPFLVIFDKNTFIRYNEESGKLQIKFEEYNLVDIEAEFKLESHISKIKPPLGLTPRFIHDDDRRIEIKEAMKRYLDKDMTIPKEWIEEYNELLLKITKKIQPGD